MQKFKTPKRLRYPLIGIMALSLVLKAGARPASALYERFTGPAGEQITTFLGLVGGGAVTPIVVGAINLLPFFVLILAGGIIIWQGYAGYQEYQRENYAGISKPVMNIIIVIMLIFMTDALSALLFQNAG